MYQLKNQDVVVAESDAEIVYSVEQQGWQIGREIIADPSMALHAVSPRPLVSPVEFKLLWTSPERLALKAIRQTDPVLDDFFDIIEDTRLTRIDLNLSSTQHGIGYCLTKLVEAAVLVEADVSVRREQILSGKPR